MAITFAPTPGTVLMCDFKGSIPPEMNKIRHVIVVSPRRRRTHGTCLVVPISTVAPNPIEKYHHRIPADTYSFFKAGTDCWAKGDMVTNVSPARLDRVIDNGKYCAPKLNPDDTLCIQKIVWEAIGAPIPLSEPADSADEEETIIAEAVSVTVISELKNSME
jgi:mRNA interferase MazF